MLQKNKKRTLLRKALLLKYLLFQSHGDLLRIFLLKIHEKKILRKIYKKIILRPLPRKGYLIFIGEWMGNLGNNLIQLSNALNIAIETKSKLFLPKHDIIKSTNFDFTDPKNNNCNKEIKGIFYYSFQCFVYSLDGKDVERRKIYQEYVLPLLPQVEIDEVGPKTLVLNIRSGTDIFRADPPPSPQYVQPPLSYYKHIIENGNYKDILIVTNKDRKNPCVEKLLSWNKNIRIMESSPIRDMSAVLKARYLVIGLTTFSIQLALMSQNLKKLYQPHFIKLYSQPHFINGVKDYSIYNYKFNNYINPGEWHCTKEQLNMMINHHIQDVEVLHKIVN